MSSNIAGEYINTLPIEDTFGNLPPGEYTFEIDINGGEYTETVSICISSDHQCIFHPSGHRVKDASIVVRQDRQCTDTSDH